MPPTSPQTQLDPRLVTLAKAIRQTESGGNFAAKGGSGEYGAYQFLPTTWSGASQKFLGQPVPLEQATPEQQNEVAYKQLEEWSKQHPDWNIGNYASAWNAGPGKPDAYKENYTGTNSSGVRYDTPAYAKSVAEAYHQIKDQGSQAAPEPPQAPTAPQDTSGALFPSQGSDSPIAAGLKTLGNVPGSLLNFAKGAIDTVNPISTIGRLGQIPAAISDLAKQGQTPGQLAGNLAQGAYEAIVPSGGRALLRGDTQEAQKDITNDPIGQVAPFVLGAEGAAKGIGQGAAFDSAISKTAQTVTKPAGAVLGGIGSGIGNLGKFGVSQVTGLKPDTLGTVADNPTAFTSEARGTLDRKAVADEIKSGLDARMAELEDTGKEYEPIRNAHTEDTSISSSETKTVNLGNGSKLEYPLEEAPNEVLSLPELRAKLDLLKQQPRVPADVVSSLERTIADKAQSDTVPAVVKVDPNWFTRAIRETTGLGVRGGKVIAKTTSDIREARDVRALQDLYDRWQPTFAKGKLSNKEYLNFRTDVAKVAKFERDLGKSGALENLAGIIRGKFNTAYGGQIPGLRDTVNKEGTVLKEGLDTRFAKQRNELDTLRKGLIDSNGELTTAGINKIANAVGKGKDLELAKLEAIIPGITRKIKIVKAIEDIEDAKGQKVGAYARGGLAVLGIGTMNIPAIIGSILASPEIAVPLLRQYGMAKPLVDAALKALKNGASAVNNAPSSALLNSPVQMPQLPAQLRAQ